MNKPITKQVWTSIVERLAVGEKLTLILEENGLHPMDFSEALANDPEAMNRYAAARRMRTETLVDELITIADTEQDLFRAKIKIDTRKWIATKLIPETYGDRLDVNVNQTIDLRAALDAAQSRRTIAIDVTPKEITGLEPVENISPINDLEIDIFD